MSWFRIDDAMFDHPKWLLALSIAGSDAVHLWLRLGTWCSRHLTDGHIPAHVAVTFSVDGSRSGKRTACAWRALVEAALCTRDAHGAYTMCSYLEYNPSREKITAERGRKAKNQQDRRDRSFVTGDAPENDTGDQPRPVPSRPLPTPYEGFERARTHVANPGPEPETEPASLPPPEPPPRSLVRATTEATARVVSLPGPEPDREYLDSALMAGIGPAQARSTWAHYWGAGLPPGGVERLTPWLVQRAKERANQLARASPRPGGAGAGRAVASVEPKAKHVRVAAHYGIDLHALVAVLHERKIVETLGTDAFHEHLERALAAEAKRKVDAGEVPAPKPRSVSR